MKQISLFVCFLLLSVGVMAQGQTFIKTAGKPVTGMISTEDGNLIQAGSVLELDRGTAAEGNFQFIYTVLGMKLYPLGAGAAYDKVTVTEVRHQQKTGLYFAIVEIAKSSYLVEIDKAVRSGEIKSITSTAN